MSTLDALMMTAEPFIRVGEIVALVLSAVAIYFAGRQYEDSKELLSNARAHAEKLEAVASALPTRFVGTFPDNLRPIGDLVRTANKSLLVLVDFVGYGYYSNPVAFGAYYKALRQHAIDSKVQLQIICYDKAGRGGKDAVENQFPPDQFEEQRKSHAFQQFYKVHFPALKEPDKQEDFDRESWEHEEAYRSNLWQNGKDTTVTLTGSPLPFLLWLRDGEEAIVSFQNLTSFGDFSFRTTDPSFIDFFKAQMTLVSRTGTPYAPPSVGTPRKPLLVD
jgi:hypothetical protein